MGKTKVLLKLDVDDFIDVETIIENIELTIFGVRNVELVEAYEED